MSTGTVSLWRRARHERNKRSSALPVTLCFVLSVKSTSVDSSSHFLITYAEYQVLLLFLPNEGGELDGHNMCDLTCSSSDFCHT